MEQVTVKIGNEIVKVAQHSYAIQIWVGGKWHTTAIYPPDALEAAKRHISVIERECRIMQLN